MPAYRSERVYSRHSSRVYFDGTFEFRRADKTQPRVIFTRDHDDGNTFEVYEVDVDVCSGHIYAREKNATMKLVGVTPRRRSEVTLTNRLTR